MACSATTPSPSGALVAFSLALALLLGCAIGVGAQAAGTLKSYQMIGRRAGLGGLGGSSLQQFSSFGTSCAFLGDLDGDNVGDVVVGAPGHQMAGDWGYRPGVVFILFLNTDGTVRDKTVIGQSTLRNYAPPALSRFGSSVANIGDLDGDGVVDICVGAKYEQSSAAAQTSNQDYVGAIYVVFLHRNGTVRGSNRIRAEDYPGTLQTPWSTFGQSIAAIEPARNGVVPLCVGEGNARSGAVHIMQLYANGTFTDINTLSNSSLSLQLPEFPAFGYSVAPIGDLDGDANQDIVVGASAADAVFVLFLTANKTVKSVRKIADSTAGMQSGSIDPGSYFGSSIANLGDVDKDGVDDLFVGAQYADLGGPFGAQSIGAGFVLFLNRDGTVRGWRKIDYLPTGGLEGVIKDRYDFGSGACGLGDLNRDGAPDAFVGASGADIPGDGGTYGATFSLFLNAAAEITTTGVATGAIPSTPTSVNAGSLLPVSSWLLLLCGTLTVLLWQGR